MALRGRMVQLEGKIETMEETMAQERAALRRQLADLRGAAGGSPCGEGGAGGAGWNPEGERGRCGG